MLGPHGFAILKCPQKPTTRPSRWSLPGAFCVEFPHVVPCNRGIMGICIEIVFNIFSLIKAWKQWGDCGFVSNNPKTKPFHGDPFSSDVHVPTMHLWIFGMGGRMDAMSSNRGYYIYTYIISRIFWQSQLLNLNHITQLETYPNLKEEVGGSIPGCEISSLLDIKTC